MTPIASKGASAAGVPPPLPKGWAAAKVLQGARRLRSQFFQSTFRTCPRGPAPVSTERGLRRGGGQPTGGKIEMQIDTLPE